MNKQSIYIIAIGLLMVVVLALLIIGAKSLGNPNNRELGSEMATCNEGETKIFRNNYVKFEYPCDWYFVSKDITNSNDFDIREDDGRYIGFITMQELTELDEYSKNKSPSNCESGDYFSETKVTVKNKGGSSLDACHHEEHGGETLTIQIANERYLSITSLEGGILNQIIPSLIVN